MRKIALIFIGLVAMLFLNCAAPIRDLTHVQYIDRENFQWITMTEEGIALFPITAGIGSKDFKMLLAGHFDELLPETVAGDSYMLWRQTLEALESTDMVDVYQDMMNGYYTTGIVSKNKAQEIYDAIDMRYGLFCRIVDFDKNNKLDYDIFVGFHHAQDAEAQAHVVVIDLKEGHIVQEIIGRADSRAVGLVTYNRDYDVYSEIIARSVLSKLPGSRVASPYEVTY